LPGGGGLGDPRERDPELVRQDVLDGLVSVEQARDAYGVALTANGVLDTAETARLRHSARTE
jgi:N-methylhydantoinase B